VGVFSRLVVGWLLANRESEEMSKLLIEDSYLKHNIQPGQITAHSDRGASMTAQGVAEFLGKLVLRQNSIAG
jgi:transposase InsO family protein